MFSCFTDKKFFKKFLMIALPVMLSAFVTFLVSFLDNIMVGFVSNEAVSGVYASNQVTFVFNLVVYGVLEGAGIFIQQYHGKKDAINEKKCFIFKILSLLIFLIITIPLLYLFAKYIIILYTKSDQNYELIYSEAMNYLNLIIISYIPFSIGYLYSTTLREIGETKYAFYSSLIAIIINTSFNALFILTFKMGVRGAAIATIIARTCEMLFLIIICHTKKFDFCTHLLSNFKLDFGLYKKIIKKGFMLFINEIGYSVGTMLQSLAFSQRDGVLSAISILTTVTNIMTILIQGLSTAIGVMVGQDLGQNDFEKAWDDNKKLNLLAMYMCLFTCIVLVSTSYFIPYMFKEVDINQKEIATKLIIVYALMLVFNCWSITCYYTLKAGGKTLLTLILDTGSLFILYVPFSFLLATKTNLNIIYVYLIVRSLDILRTIIGFVLVNKKSWLVNLTLQNNNSLD